MSPVKGYAALSAKAQLTPFTFSRRELTANDVLITIHFCGICHSDIHQVNNEWGGSLFPMVPGHEIVGIVNQIGSAVNRFNIGDRVGVGCYVDSCRQCENCEDNLDQYCLNGITTTYNARSRDGTEIMQGGYSTQIVVNEDYVLAVPDNLPLDATAPLLCAGITLYSPLKHWKCSANTKVAIIGLGGLGHIGVKLAHAMQAEVTVLSHSPTKENDSKRLGANHFYTTRDPQTFKKLANSFDLIINTVSAQLKWDDYLNLLKRDGTMVVLGVPEQSVPITAFSLINGRRRIAGSLIGSITETQEMLNFCAKHAITADIELIKAREINAAYERVLNSDVKYRFVIDTLSID